MLATMPPSERASRAPDFLSGRPIVLYQRFFQEFGRDGWPVGTATLLSPTEVVPDSASRSGLYISVSADYEFVGGQASPYRWNIDGYWRWTPTADCCQTTADHVAIAWGGSLGLLNDYAYGYYTNGASIPTYRGHVSVNAGVEWYFSEWKQIDRATWKGASWGHILATIAEPHIQNYQSGVSLEYVHTYTTIAVSVSFGFPSPYITVSPADGNWPPVGLQADHVLKVDRRVRRSDGAPTPARNQAPWVPYRCAVAGRRDSWADCWLRRSSPVAPVDRAAHQSREQQSA